MTDTTYLYMQRSLFISACAALLAFCYPLNIHAETPAGPTALVIKAGRVDVGNGNSIANATIVIEDGVITAVGSDIEIPSGADLVDFSDGVITPGLIDAGASVTNETIGVEFTQHASAPDLATAMKPHWSFPIFGFPEEDDAPVKQCPFMHLHVSGETCRYCGFPNDKPLGDMAVGVSQWQTVVEGESEVVPHTRHIDAIDLDSPDFMRLARYGVTTVFATPDTAAVIGPKGAILKTAGREDQRIVSQDSAVQAAMGRDPSARGGGNRRPSRYFVSFRTRRPTTRMGVAWVFRKAFFDAQAAMAGLPLVGGADTPSNEAIEALKQIIKGEISLRIQARTQMDILTAIRLADEFGLRFTLTEAVDAYRCTEDIKQRDIPVVFGPIFTEPTGWRLYSRETFKPKLSTATALVEAGIPVALTANEMRDEEGLAAQAACAMRFGLTYQQALAAVTSQPARILGIDSSVGTIEPGKSGDLILWNGEPFAATTSIKAVLIGGETVYKAK